MLVSIYKKWEWQKLKSLPNIYSLLHPQLLIPSFIQSDHVPQVMVKGGSREMCETFGKFCKGMILIQLEV